MEGGVGVGAWMGQRIDVRVDLGKGVRVGGCSACRAYLVLVELNSYLGCKNGICPEKL